jgi:hypothetical protein
MVIGFAVIGMMIVMLVLRELRGCPLLAPSFNCLGADGISAVEPRLAVPSAWRRQPPLTRCGSRCGRPLAHPWRSAMPHCHPIAQRTASTKF